MLWLAGGVPLVYPVEAAYCSWGRSWCEGTAYYIKNNWDSRRGSVCLQEEAVRETFSWMNLSSLQRIHVYPHTLTHLLLFHIEYGKKNIFSATSRVMRHVEDSGFSTGKVEHRRSRRWLGGERGKSDIVLINSASRPLATTNHGCSLHSPSVPPQPLTLSCPPISFLLLTSHLLCHLSPPPHPPAAHMRLLLDLKSRDTLPVWLCQISNSFDSVSVRLPVSLSLILLC